MTDHYKHEYAVCHDEPHTTAPHPYLGEPHTTAPHPYLGKIENEKPQVARAPDLLDAMARTFRERNAVYKDNWISCGQVMRVMFPNGIMVDTQEQHEMFGILYQIVGKLTRFAGSGCTHQDSIHDLAVYSAIAEHLLLKNGEDGKIGV